ncbi:MAG: tetraacyldisaccharide 4'-kinase, partial [Phenylobacterium sp.]|nr:tetraacyldisaccharide 4'-kinase [Phenylobacterium sp.]
MKLSTPRWWYVRERDRSSMPMTRALLTPISWIWTVVTARRIARTEACEPGAP